MVYPVFNFCGVCSLVLFAEIPVWFQHWFSQWNSKADIQNNGATRNVSKHCLGSLQRNTAFVSVQKTDVWIVFSILSDNYTWLNLSHFSPRKQPRLLFFPFLPPEFWLPLLDGCDTALWIQVILPPHESATFLPYRKLQNVRSSQQFLSGKSDKLDLPLLLLLRTKPCLALPNGQGESWPSGWSRGGQA